MYIEYPQLCIETRVCVCVCMHVQICMGIPVHIAESRAIVFFSLAMRAYMRMHKKKIPTPAWCVRRHERTRTRQLAEARVCLLHMRYVQPPYYHHTAICIMCVHMCKYICMSLDAVSGTHCLHVYVYAHVYMYVHTYMYMYM